MLHRAQITDTNQIRNFVLAGNATFTLRNENTGNHLTFKVRQKKVKGNPVTPHFVSVLTGPDNTSNYSFLGTIFNSDLGTYRLGRKSRIGTDSRSNLTFMWFANRLLSNKPLPEGVTFFHEGRCGACGKTLTVPTSIESGIGPVCAKFRG